MISFNGGTALGWLDDIYVNGVKITKAYFNDTQVYGPNTSFSTIFSFSLSPDSGIFESSTVPQLSSTYADAFISQGYTQGPGKDTVYRVTLAEGYRLDTSDGIFNAGTSVNLYEGHSVTGANTSHNGSTSCSLQRAGDI